jgi:uncharacterized protein YbjT (DUF2867 family)
MSEKTLIRAVITGATGMVGEGVLNECLKSDAVEKILVIGRRSCEITHPKLTEIIHQDFFDLSAIKNQFAGYDACFFCLGVSALGRSNDEYEKQTYDLTMDFAKTLVQTNIATTFCYISQQGADPTGKSFLNWARVKGKTENELLKLPFKEVYIFRPGFLKQTAGLKHANKLYTYLNWVYPILRKVSTGYASTLTELGKAMISSATEGYEKQIIEVEDIVKLSKK